MEEKTLKHRLEEAKKWEQEMRMAIADLNALGTQKTAATTVETGVCIGSNKIGALSDLPPSLRQADASLLMSYAERTYPRDVFTSLAEGFRRMLNAAYSEGLEMGREEQRRKGGQIY